MIHRHRYKVIVIVVSEGSAQSTLKVKERRRKSKEELETNIRDDLKNKFCLRYQISHQRDLEYLLRVNEGRTREERQRMGRLLSKKTVKEMRMKVGKESIWHTQCEILQAKCKQQDWVVISSSAQILSLSIGLLCMKGVKVRVKVKSVKETHSFIYEEKQFTWKGSEVVLFIFQILLTANWSCKAWNMHETQVKERKRNFKVKIDQIGRPD